MKTAKDIARQAYTDAIQSKSGMSHIDHEKIKTEFNIWWARIYDGSEGRPKVFISEMSVWIDGERYIKAE